MSHPYAGLSDVGRKRTKNDDRWNADLALGLFIVADGVGSTTHGDIAAAMVVEGLPVYVARYLGAASLNDPQALDRMGRAVVEMCTDLYTRSRTDANLSSADTTLVAAVVADARALVAHLGDSRAYLHRDGQLQRLTSDHTIVQAVMDAGELSAEQAAHHPNRSVVTRHVLMTPPAKPDVNVYDLQSGDRILLCSDGLHGVVDDARIAAILTDHPDPDDACRVLIETANRGGGPDNITAVVIYADLNARPAVPVPTLAEPVAASTVAPTLQMPVQPPPAESSLAATQQLPTDWQPGPPVGPAGPVGHPLPPMDGPPPLPPRRSHAPLYLAVAMLIVLLVAVGVAAFVLWPRPTATQTPAPKPAQPPTSMHTGRPAPTQTQTQTQAAPPGPLPFPDHKHAYAAVAVDRDGNLYVIYTGGDSPKVLERTTGGISATSEPSELSQFTGLKKPHAIAVDKDGNVYVTDSADGGRVRKFSPVGGTVSVLPFDRTPDVPLGDPAGIAVDGRGNIFVADPENHRVLELQSGSDATVVALKFADLDRPTGVAVGPQGDVYVVDQGTRQVWKLSQGASTALPFGSLDKPTSVAVDGGGNVYVTDGKKVFRLTPDNQLTSFGELKEPTGVAVDGNGNVYVTDYDLGKPVQLQPPTR